MRRELWAGAMRSGSGTWARATEVVVGVAAMSAVARDRCTAWPALVDACPTGVLLVGLDGRLAEANPAARDLLGLDANRLLVAYTTDYFGLARRLPGTDGGRTETTHLRRVLRADGQSRWVEFRLVPLPVEAGRRPMIAVYLNDRTSLHLQQRTVRAQVAGLDLALSEAAVAVVVTDGSLVVQRWSPGARRLLGAPTGGEGSDLATSLDVDRGVLQPLLERARAGEVVRDAALTAGPAAGHAALRVSVTIAAADDLPPSPSSTAVSPVGTGALDGTMRLAWVLLPADEASAGAALRASERRLRKILQHISDTVTVIDESGHTLGTAGPLAGEPVLGYGPEAWAGGLNVFDLVDPADQPAIGRALDHLLSNPGRRISGVVHLRAADGRLVDAEGCAVNLLDDPDVAGILVTTRDVSQRVRDEAFVAGQADILREIASGAPLEMTMRHLVDLVDAHVEGASAALVVGTVDDGDRTFAAMTFPFPDADPLLVVTGVPPAGEVGVLDDLSALRDAPDVAAVLRADGCNGLVVVALAGAGTSPAGAAHPPLGALVCLLAEARRPSPRELDVLRSVADLAVIAVERERSEHDLAQQALHDELTGLANRHLLLDRLEQALNRAKRRGQSLALMFLDLDRFKTVNDTLGHDVGDQLLRQFAERLRVLVRPEDTVARFGGDEFVVLVESVVDEQDAAQIADRLEGAMAEPFDLDGRPLSVTASVGIVIGKGEDHPAALLRNADTAMYRAKELGRNRTEIYDTHLEAHLADRTQLGSDLRNALVEGQLRVTYQPVVDLRSGEMRMIEALLHWDHPRHGRLLPHDFLGVAEDSGQGLELAAWVVERALTDLAAFARDPAWLAAPGWPRPPRLSVNLSARQLAHPDLVGRIELALARHGFVPQNLAIDVSERVVASAGEMALQNLAQLHRLGVGIVLDDIGAGPATPLLSVLARVPADVLKIDPSVIAAMGVGATDDHRESLQRSLAAGLLGLGRGLGLTVIAEGVDNHRRLQQIRQLGYDLAQGNALGAPVEAVGLVSLLPR